MYLRRILLGVVLVISLIAAVIWYYTWDQLYRPVKETRFFMGTFFTITTYGEQSKEAVEYAFEEIARIEGITNLTGSPVAEINRHSGGSEVRVPLELFQLIRRVLMLQQRVDGYFDPSIGSLVELWGFGYDGEGRVPNDRLIKQALSQLKATPIELDHTKQTVRIAYGVKLDLGGVAKGYAVDRAVGVLQKKGVRNALVNGGESSIRAIGTRLDGKPWRIGIAHPRREQWAGVLQLPAGMALGTSADTQHYFVADDGRRYSHLINPKTGFPPDDVYSITVMSPAAMDADIYSTALFVAEGNNRVELAKMWEIEAMVVVPNQSPLFTEHFKIEPE
jgi:thiamine biosynthesis lipoprotein